MSFVCIMYIAERRSQATEGRSQTNVAVLEALLFQKLMRPLTLSHPNRGLMT